MNVGNILHNPGGGIVAPAAIQPHAVLVNVLMTGIAFGLSRSKFQVLVAILAIELFVLPCKFKAGGSVIEACCFGIYFPACWLVALPAGNR